MIYENRNRILRNDHVLTFVIFYSFLELLTILFDMNAKIFSVLFTMFAGLGYSQTVVVFVANQPLQFTVDAGPDQDYIQGMTLGVSPIATGGGNNYVYSWSPAELLLDPTTANPIVLELNSDITFEIQVTDLSSGCSKTDQVFVTLSNQLNDFSDITVGIYPNPTLGSMQLHSSVLVETIVIRSLSGSILQIINKVNSHYVSLDLTPFSEGFYFADVTFSTGDRQTFKLCRIISAH
jgi:hypothetical protein